MYAIRSYYESFRAAGYTTWGGSANGFSGRANNLHQGFEILHERGFSAEGLEILRPVDLGADEPSLEIA